MNTMSQRARGRNGRRTSFVQRPTNNDTASTPRATPLRALIPGAPAGLVIEGPGALAFALAAMEGA